jgi:hypothetical protein
LFVARDDEVDRRAAQRFDDVEVLLARHAEDADHALVPERRDQQIGPLRHDGNIRRPATARRPEAPPRALR